MPSLSALLKQPRLESLLGAALLVPSARLAAGNAKPLENDQRKSTDLEALVPQSENSESTYETSTTDLINFVDAKFHPDEMPDQTFDGISVRRRHSENYLRQTPRPVRFLLTDCPKC